MASSRWLNLELRDSRGAPMAGRPYALTLPDGSTRDGSLDDKGRLHERVPAQVERLTLDVAHRRFELDVRGLPAPSTIDGAQARLNQLNYFAGDVDGELNRFTEGALRRFQRDQQLPVTGALDPATARALQQEHGT